MSRVGVKASVAAVPLMQKMLPSYASAFCATAVSIGGHHNASTLNTPTLTIFCPEVEWNYAVIIGLAEAKDVPLQISGAILCMQTVAFVSLLSP